ncbi:hypothetical protein DCAR_0623687 [Daucus carota subsp. sativus]|uniref:Uncharacterized protein n=1 Tax=Daucus carota subsp. sativus TaxID=79200 RepID=A0A164VD08_DAUCS|nr:hypothetical protein DCAR_0623687 [Daucus carota subsp. sativus]
MGRPNRAKDKDGDPLRTQNGKRLDCQKSISDRKKANLDRLKVSMQRAKALGGEIPILNSLSLQIPTSDSQFRIYRRTPASNIYSTTRGKDPFAHHHRRKEFTPIEAVMLEPIDREYAMAVGGFRMPEE